MPNAALTDEAPVYHRPMARPAGLDEEQALDLEALPAPPEPSDVLRRLLATPTIASKKWVYRQYDHMVRTNSVVMPGMGAAVVRIKGTKRALALAVDGNGRHVYLDPFVGAQLAVAEAARNVACAGAQPIGATNCLNFGNPERPEIMWQFERAVAGIGTACRALDIPITGGNVSLYNETDGQGILPTPVLGVVGLLEDVTRAITRTFQQCGDHIVLLGASREEFGGSEFLKVMYGLLRGQPPAIDLHLEAALQRLLFEGAAIGLLRSAHDCAEGGLAVTVAECCFDTSLGADICVPAIPVSAEAFAVSAALFGESASRVVVSTTPDRSAELLSRARSAAVPAAVVGEVGGERIRVTVGTHEALDLPVADLERTWSTSVGHKFGPGTFNGTGAGN